MMVMGLIHANRRRLIGSWMLVLCIVALILLLAITLLGAVIGGAGGMRYHRKLETTEAEYLQ